MGKTETSVYLSYLLRHHPEAANLDMDEHGWVSVSQLIDHVNAAGKYALSPDFLRDIVQTDDKGRYRFSPDGARIKACQGHSIPWVIPEMEWREPPQYLYHGTTADAWEKIQSSGGISRMQRHAVHMQSNEKKAWQSAKRWHRIPVVLKIDAAQMFADDIAFGLTENEVWCCDAVPTEYIVEVILEQTQT